MLVPVKLHRSWQPYSWSNRRFDARPWPQLAQFYWQVADAYPDLLATISIIESIAGRSEAHLLAANYTIGAVLHVVTRDAIVPPYSVISVSVFPAGPRSSEAVVEISHTSTSGLTDAIIKPADEAVPLFWRFANAKFGI